ncbi:hypothetical protein [Gimesia chilikensis]|uniref:hypothetical protein n=1 Tax=Gimesia chilikensis TaxID=2605989 RepID=UPI00119E987E|nr:hypothetical protein [Gimesia chilikensis]
MTNFRTPNQKKVRLHAIRGKRSQLETDRETDQVSDVPASYHKGNVACGSESSDVIYHSVPASRRVIARRVIV